MAVMEPDEQLDAVHLLWHRRATGPDGVSDSKLLGVFTSREAAEHEIPTFSGREGFTDYPSEFEIELIPHDQTIFDPIDSGLAARVRGFLDGSDPEPVLSAARRGGLGLYSIVEEIHDQAINVQQAEAAIWQVISVWAARGWPDRSEAGGAEPATAELFWAYRRQGYPSEPGWADRQHPDWKRRIRAYREVLLWESYPSPEAVLELIRSLALAADGVEELHFLARGPLTSLFLVIDDSARVLANLRRDSRPRIVALAEEFDRA